ncbi:tRNA adenosine deaminase-associated protein [Tessaracoccus sp. MC1865]|uniref:tRNA adenosine deaminase-associated protein n=1 Tax=unclassified Tessaracoccus TaxID=2635419 RepID=UPI0016034C30|nr:tRNA adenosine deaminase-associated protein [Tessaracoccus sp. MC1865]MBB1482756.1 tRNA adenosine deaminase-associated protein [Tessaracoccus sp. MC1865]MBB1509955.1 tRNA adenosine deaminase-associated protein [Tessaracoccus sp. MC1756]QTO37797.1 tRNA adenosine deaminase-associated protein [Tessaracoccus sp. MC1865]
MDVFDEDAEPFDLKNDVEETDDADLDDFDDDDDDLEDATEDDIDLVVALYREDGKATAVPMDYDLANDFDELIRQLSRLPGDSGADGWVSVAGEFFVLCRVRGRTVEVLLSDATAANDWPLARDVVDYLGEDVPDEDDDSFPLGDLEIYAASGLRGFEMEAIATDYDEDSDVLLGVIAKKLKIGAEFERAAESFDD